jgi:hypothetical protein
MDPASYEELRKDPLLSQYLPRPGASEEERRAAAERLKKVLPDLSQMAMDEMKAHSDVAKGQEGVWRGVGAIGAGMFKYLGVSSVANTLENFDKSRGSFTATRRSNMAQELLQSLTSGKDLPDVVQSRGQLAQGMLMNLHSMRVQPRFSGIEDAWKNIQMEALSRDPLEQKLDQMVQQHLIKILEDNAKLIGLQEETKEAIKDLRR